MKVRLVSHTPKPLKLIYVAAKTCASELSPQEIWDHPVQRETMIKFIEEILMAGHLSVTEHVSFTWAISGVSRACTHQLVRSRLASFSQQSQRYVTFGETLGYAIPGTIKKKRHKALIPYLETVERSRHLYLQLVKAGVSPEDARYLLPNAAFTNIVITMNFRELLHSASLRLCQRAQWEIRALFKEMKKEISQIEPFLGKKLIPKCQILGYCTEPKSCGLMPKRRIKKVKEKKTKK